MQNSLSQPATATTTPSPSDEPWHHTTMPTTWSVATHPIVIQHPQEPHFTTIIKPYFNIGNTINYQTHHNTK